MSNQSINNNMSNEHSINNHAIVCLLLIVSYNMRDPITHTHNKKKRVLNLWIVMYLLRLLTQCFIVVIESRVPLDRR
jgi:hypothetical protein